MQKIKKHLPLVVVIGILFATGIVFANVAINQNRVNVSTVSADVNEDEDKDEDEDKNEDEDKDEDESAKKQEEKARESAKKQTERERESAKKSLEDDEDEKDSEDSEDSEDASDSDEGDEVDEEDEIDELDDVKDLAKHIVKMEIKLNLAETAGINVSAMRNSLTAIKSLLSQAEEKATAGDIDGAKILTELADKKLEALKKSLELVFNDDDEGLEEDDDDMDDEAKEYKNIVAQFVHNLKELGGLSGGIGEQVRAVAQAQNDDIDDVEESINDIKERGKFAKFLVGPKYDSIAEVKNAIVENQARIKVLTEVMNQITDPAVKLVLQDQINNFQQENNKLQAFIAEEENIASVFGWLIRMFQ